MKKFAEPAPGSFEAADLFRLRVGLAASYEQRLQDLEDMYRFNVEVEDRNPHLHEIAAWLRNSSALRKD